VSATTLETLSVRDFRNLAHVELRLPREGAVVVGENGHGKTNLLEATYYLQLLRSARGARDAELVRFGGEGFHVAARGQFPQAREVRVGFVKTGTKKRVTQDGAEAKRLTDALGGVPSVLVSPRDAGIVAGAPADRRRFMDIALALSSPTYLSALAAYRGALGRRNAALREGARHASRSTLASVQAWEPALAQHGAVLRAARRAWVQCYGAEYTRLVSAIGERPGSAMHYVVRVGGGADALRAAGETADTASALMAEFEATRERDLRTGVTHAGPHRDDLALTLAKRDLRRFGSAGQQRSAALALRLLELATLRERIGGAPLLLLDDPFAELDERRAACVLALLGEAGIHQVVLAVPRASEIPASFTRLARHAITDGTLTAA
jgi:DNA replication and repair protein RecF